MNMVILLCIMYAHLINTVLFIILNKEMHIFGTGCMCSQDLFCWWYSRKKFETTIQYYELLEDRDNFFSS